MANLTLVGDNIGTTVTTNAAASEVVINGIGGSLTQPGVIQLATTGEISQGTNTTKAVTAKDVKALFDALIA